MSLDGLAMLIGYAVIWLTAITTSIGAAWAALNFASHLLIAGRKVWWLRKAMQHYEQIEPHPKKDEA